ncbi:MAG: phospholipase D family protein [Candidatus Omnitrophica bacterium CG07_land_8_20_14_0_80_50_8]|nr:MAG: hypothetical protein AUJ71_03115 [Candidatus Omnitrophica bacterium CG1_02_49_16]PIU40220.1 MAG: phospholipase D family protein [Candidatus Omnitrophica bacterium CG07_land_8_20_14_0_80_50_8]
MKNAGVLILVLFLSLGSAGAATQEAYFSPNGHVRNRIVEEITNAKESIDIAVFNITSAGIRTALKRAQKNGVSIRILTDQGQSEDAHSVVGLLQKDGFKIKLIKGKGRNGLMHNKFAIFDRRLLTTGSYNWTESAERYNYENALFLPDKDLIKTYQKEFNWIWSEN